MQQGARPLSSQTGETETGDSEDLSNDWLTDIDGANNRVADRIGDRLSPLHLDPTGDNYVAGLDEHFRRNRGIVYTPFHLISYMLDMLPPSLRPDRIVDLGCGSGRFLLEAGQRFPKAQLIGVDTDPVALSIARLRSNAMRMSERLSLIEQDLRTVNFDKIEGQTLYLGNPPYVRHHVLPRDWKSWLASEAASLDLPASGRSSLYVYAFVKIARLASIGDVGLLVTPQEWLTSDYGRLVRSLMVGPLGLSSIDIVDPRSSLFDGFETTAAISLFRIGNRPESVSIRQSKSTGLKMRLVRSYSRRASELSPTSRWSLGAVSAIPYNQGTLELGELFDVHRGQATGCNAFWIKGTRSLDLPSSIQQPSVTRAAELIRSNGNLSRLDGLRVVVNLPESLTGLPIDERRQVEEFLSAGLRLGVDQGFLARQRRQWWHVNLRTPAPILVTYMARRPPTFVRNTVEASTVNIAHGLYPKLFMSTSVLDNMSLLLRSVFTVDEGRVYAGGLLKFEPSDISRIRLPLKRITELLADNHLEQI